MPSRSYLPHRISDHYWDILVLVSSGGILLLTLYCLMHGITTVFMHLYYFPIILLSYHYHKKGVGYAALLSLAYLGMVVYFEYAQPIEVIGAVLRILSFIGVAVIVAYLSINIEKRQSQYRILNKFNQGIVSNANVWLFVLDAKGNILVWNRAAEEISGYTKGEVIGRKTIWKQLYPENDYRKTITQTISKIISEKRFFENFETVITTKNHEIKTISWNTRAVSGKKGRPNHFISIGIDITERKRAEAALRETKDYLENLIGYANAPIIVWNPRFEITEFNHAFEVLTGLSREDVLGKHLSILFPVESWNKSLSLIRKTPAGERWESVEIPIHDVSGDTHIVLWNSANISDSSGAVIATIAQGQDITERKRTEEALALASKKLNLLSNITRHDILNQLTALRGFLELSHDHLNDPDRMIKYIEKEEMAALTIENQITFTRNYQDLGVKAPVWQNVNDNIMRVLTQLPMRAVRVDVDREDLEIFADALFEKVFYNLIDNALRYGGDKMSTIRVSSQETDNGLTILCEDDGVGISENDKSHLFTQGFGKNTGFGLFLTREILAITGIAITENGTPGKGARFVIAVPNAGYRYTGSGE
jgi:PAS domain S-box-containing protein